MLASSCKVYLTAIGRINPCHSRSGITGVQKNHLYMSSEELPYPKLVAPFIIIRKHLVFHPCFPTSFVTVRTESPCAVPLCINIHRRILPPYLRISMEVSLVYPAAQGADRCADASPQIVFEDPEMCNPLHWIPFPINT